MGTLSIAMAIAVAVPQSSPVADPITRWHPIVAEASVRFGIPQGWIERVMRAESDGRTSQGDRPIRSRVGAIGLMQLMPATWADIRQTYKLGSDPDDPHDNILAGTAYLREMYDRFGYPGLFAGYNAGPARYAWSLATGRHLPTETIAYLASVTGMATNVGATRPMTAIQSLFVVRHDHSRESADGASPQTSPDVAPSLFAVRSGTP